MGRASPLTTKSGCPVHLYSKRGLTHHWKLVTLLTNTPSSGIGHEYKTLSCNPHKEDVLNLRLSDLQTQDRIYWKENKAHCFTVRLAYLVTLRLNQGGVVKHSKAHEDKRLWNKLWRLRIPLKVRNFLWRAYSDVLPTWANIAWRRLPIDPSCAICGQAEESVCHALWECSLATNIWAMVKGKM